MKKTNAISFSFLVALSVVATSVIVVVGCTTKRAEVKNVPPNFDNVNSLSSEYGKVKLTEATVFLWPQGGDLREVARKVYLASNELDAYQLKTYRKLSIEAQYGAGDSALGVEKGMECKTKYDATVKPVENIDPDLGFDPSIDSDPGDIWVKEYKPAQSDDEKKEIAACQGLETEWKQIEAQIKTQSLSSMLEGIFKAIDPGYPDTVVNNKIKNADKIDSLNWIIDIQPNKDGAPAVNISLKNFLTDGFNPSTAADAADPITDVSYDPEPQKHQLRFTVQDPVKNESGERSGAAYRFVVERTKDFAGQARFKGDVQLVKDGVVLRTGAAKFQGRITPAKPE